MWEQISLRIQTTFQVEFTCCVGKTTAPLVTANKFNLNDILVLHLVNGKDFFIPLSATYTPSVFGMSLETLVRTYGPVREMPQDALLKAESTSYTDSKAAGE